MAYGSLQTDVALSSFTATGIPVTIVATRSTDKFGWTIGGGIESMFAANWTAKIEFLYMDLGSISNSVVLPAAAGFPLGANVTSRVTDSVIRGGINYHFSAGPGAVCFALCRRRETNRQRGARDMAVLVVALRAFDRLREASLASTRFVQRLSQE